MADFHDRRRRVAAGIAGVGVVAIVAWLLLRTDPPVAAPAPPARPPAVATAPLPGAPVRVSPPAPAPAPPPAAAADPEPAAEPIVEEEHPDAVPISVMLRDGTTGDIVRGATLALVGENGSETRLTCGLRGETHVLGDSSPLRRGQPFSLRFRARFPEGFVAEGKDALQVRGTVARFAEEVVVNLQAWPEAKVFLRVEEQDGSPAPGTSVLSVRAGVGLLDAFGETTDARGESRLRGVPLLRGENVSAVVERDDRGAISKPLRLADRDEEYRLVAVLPAEHPQSGSAIGVGGGASGGFFGGRRRRGNLVLGETGSCEARVFRRDGRPASGVLVLLGGRETQADEEGMAVFETVLPGLHVASVRELGFFVETKTVTVVAGEKVHVELHQADGATLTVSVCDDAGDPVAGATLAVEAGNTAWCLMRGDTQVLGIHTDRAGKAVLPGLPPGAVTVTARFGSRAASESAESGGAVEIRLPPPK